MRLISMLLGTVVVLALASPAANACTCAAPRSPCEAYGTAAAVFVGTVAGEREIEQSQSTNPAELDWNPVKYKFSVEQAYEGVHGTQIEVFTGLGGGDCGFPFQPGRRYLVYAYRKKEKLVTSSCSRTSLFEAAKEDVAFLSTLSSAAPDVTLTGEIHSAGVRGKFVSSEVLISIEAGEERKEVRPEADGGFRVTGLSAGKIKVSLKLPEKFTTARVDHELTVKKRGCAHVVWRVTDKVTH